MRVLKTYLNSEGVTVTVYATAAARPSEKTWRGNSKYSISNIGRLQAVTGSRKVNVTVDARIF